MDLICCGWDNRGVASGEGKIFTGLLDGSFVALDQQTGQLLWRTQLEDWHDGYSLTGAYRYYDGLVFTGISGGEEAARGRRQRWMPRPARSSGSSTRSRHRQHRRLCL